ncbi:MAG: SymE family type I addiction module toxin [Proteobacteria bacterium]|nr:SymE family type I addiction module toxin [Pseudomonadota bacterium]
MTHAQPLPAATPDPTSRNLIRRLTIAHGTRSVREPSGHSTPVPMLRLQGAWLRRAGFAVGVPVIVRVSGGRLVIERPEPERDHAHS